MGYHSNVYMKFHPLGIGDTGQCAEALRLGQDEIAWPFVTVIPASASGFVL